MSIDFRGTTYTTQAELEGLKESDPAAYRDLLSKVQSESALTRSYEDITGARGYDIGNSSDGVSFAQLEMYELCLHEIGVKHKERPKEHHLIGRVKSTGELKVYKKGIKAFFLRLFGVVAFRDLTGLEPGAKRREGLGKLNKKFLSAVKDKQIHFKTDAEGDCFKSQVYNGLDYLGGQLTSSREIENFATEKPDLSRLSADQMGKGSERALLEATTASEVLELPNGEKLYLGPMSADPPATRFVVVQGRQPETPLLPQERANAEGLRAHFFADELKSLDIEVRFSGKHELDISQAEDVAEELMKTLPEEVKTGQIGIKSDNLKVPFCEQNLKVVLMKAINEQKPVRFYADIEPDHPPPLDEEGAQVEAVLPGIQERVTEAINMAIGNQRDAAANDPDIDGIPGEVLVKECVALKDCDSDLFKGPEGRARIQRSIKYIVEQLEAGESVSVFCHQGKDRSAFLVLGALLYMERCKSRDDVGKHTQVVNYLMSKRSIVNSGAYITRKGVVDDPSAKPYLDPVLDAVAEMIDRDNGVEPVEVEVTPVEVEVEPEVAIVKEAVAEKTEADKKLEEVSAELNAQLTEVKEVDPVASAEDELTQPTSIVTFGNGAELILAPLGMFSKEKPSDRPAEKMYDMIYVVDTPKADHEHIRGYDGEILRRKDRMNRYANAAFKEGMSVPRIETDAKGIKFEYVNMERRSETDRLFLSRIIKGIGEKLARGERAVIADDNGDETAAYITLGVLIYLSQVGEVANGEAAERNINMMVDKFLAKRARIGDGEKFKFDMKDRGAQELSEDGKNLEHIYAAATLAAAG